MARLKTPNKGAVAKTPQKQAKNSTPAKTPSDPGEMTKEADHGRYGTVSISSRGRNRFHVHASFKGTSDNKGPTYYIGPFGGKYSGSKQNRPKSSM